MNCHNILHYVFRSGAAMGCVEYNFPGAHVVTTINTATVTCMATGAKWEMTCINSIWEGKDEYCGKYLPYYSINPHTKGYFSDIILCLSIL